MADRNIPETAVDGKPREIFALRDAGGEPDWSTFEMDADERARLELFGGWEARYVRGDVADGMLVALKEAREAFDPFADLNVRDHGADDPCQDAAHALKTIRAAIAKAEGR